MQARLRGLGRPQELSTGLIGVCLCHQVTADASSDPRSGILDGVTGKMSVSRGRLHLCVTEELSDHRKALAESQRTGREGVPEVM